MSENEQRERLLAETGKRLEEIAKRGDSLSVARDPARPDVYLLAFRGRGLAPSLSPGEKFVEGDEWRCELRFPFRYPERPPEVRWRTEMYHPNVPLSGWMSMDDLGLTWTEAAPLDSLCERLWDLVRYAHVDLDQTANFSAREWYLSQPPERFPLDARTLSLGAKRAHDNVIRYRRRSERPAQAAEPASREPLLIDDVPPPAPLPLPPFAMSTAPSPLSATSIPAVRAEEVVFIDSPPPPATPQIEEEPAIAYVGPPDEAREEEPQRPRQALRPLPAPADEGIVFLE